ncbi:MAG: RadC family protein [Acidiferrobacteraceae bacterium]|jgi:DNA repair protein RadC
MAIRDWPIEERPREKLLEKGAGALSDAELLAIFLRTGSSGRSALDLARDLLLRFGGLRALLTAEPDVLKRILGVGPAKAAELQAVVEIGRRQLEEPLKRGRSLVSSHDAKTYLRSRLRDAGREIFCCLFLDQRHRVIALEELFAGTLHTAPVYPREVVKRALFHNAGAVIFAHNHPSGQPEPSDADQLLTDRLKQALSIVDIRVLDHLVVGDREVVSLNERGLI